MSTILVSAFKGWSGGRVGASDMFICTDDCRCGEKGYYLQIHDDGEIYSWKVNFSSTAVYYENGIKAAMIASLIKSGRIPVEVLNGHHSGE